MIIICRDESVSQTPQRPMNNVWNVRAHNGGGILIASLSLDPRRALPERDIGGTTRCVCHVMI